MGLALAVVWKHRLGETNMDLEGGRLLAVKVGCQWHFRFGLDTYKQPFVPGIVQFCVSAWDYGLVSCSAGGPVSLPCRKLVAVDTI